MRALSTCILAAVLVGVGCGGKDTGGEQRAVDQVEAFLRAADDKDGAALCATLTAETVRSLDRLAAAQGHTPGRCRDVVRARLLSFAPKPNRMLTVLSTKRDENGRYKVSARELKGLAPTGITVQREDGGYRIALLETSNSHVDLGISVACSRARVALLRLPLLPAQLARARGYFRHLSRQLGAIAGLLERVGASTSAGELGVLALRIDNLLRNDRSFGRRDVERVTALTAGLAATNESLGRDVPTADCGPDLSKIAGAAAFRRRVRAACLAANQSLSRRSETVTYRRLQDDARAALRLAGVVRTGPPVTPLLMPARTVLGDSLLAVARGARRLARGAAAGDRELVRRTSSALLYDASRATTALTILGLREDCAAVTD